MAEIAYSIDQLATIVQERVVPLFNKYRIIAFVGSVGAGKTTMIKELLRQAGVAGTVTSPTFAYVNTYQNAQGRRIYHFDLYRIDSLDGFVVNGFDEYLHDMSSICIIEWPEVIDELLQVAPLKNQTCWLKISHDARDSAWRSLYIND